MPWQAITYVGTGVTLVAFLASIVAWTIRYRSRQTERLISTAAEADRAILIQDALEFFRVDTGKLTKQQMYDIAIAQIRARSSRYSTNSALIFLLAVVAAIVTTFAIVQANPLAEATAAFDVRIDDVTFSEYGSDIKAVVSYSLFPISNKIVGKSTIFAGMMSVYDNDKIGLNTKIKKEYTCSEAPYCITAHVFDRLAKDPIVIRSPSDQAFPAKREFVIPGNTKNIRVYAEFWQKETEGGGKCVVDGSKKAPEEGIPFLKVVSVFGIPSKGQCIFARTREVFPVKIEY